jgi:hypothetical protein
MRKPIAAGQFYSEDKRELEESIKKMMPEGKKITGKVFGVISPHAGYVYSGKCAAFSYNALRNQSFDMSEINGKISEHAQKQRAVFDTFIILGPNHTGRGKRISVSGQDFEVPLGTARNDREFTKELENIYGLNEDAHANEHSIEVQLPFLLDIFKNIKIVPIILSSCSYAECSELARTLEIIAKKLKRKACVIASSDFTHYGPAYDYVPFSGTKEEVKKKLYDLDNRAIKLIESMKADKFYEISRDLTICGAEAITVSIELCKKLGARGAELLKYYTSGDVSGDYSNAVGYASIAFV